MRSGYSLINGPYHTVQYNRRLVIPLFLLVSSSVFRMPSLLLFVLFFSTSVKEKNKIFGAAILKRSDLSLVVTGTNTDKECPMWHGEVTLCTVP